jgi:hypothetical protein
LRSFTDLDAIIGMVPSQVVTRLSAIDFGRGSEALYRDQMPGMLTRRNHDKWPGVAAAFLRWTCTRAVFHRGYVLTSGIYGSKERLRPAALTSSDAW